MPYAKLGDPQTLNLYAYLGDNPLSGVDATGHGWWKNFRQRVGNFFTGHGWNTDAQLHRVTTTVTTTTTVTSVVVNGRRIPARQLRKAWEERNGQPWPKDASGRNLDAHHDEPLADGGSNDASNIKPLPHDDHVQVHKDKGDFKRWGARSGANQRGEEPGAEPAGPGVEEPGFPVVPEPAPDVPDLPPSIPIGIDPFL